MMPFSSSQEIPLFQVSWEGEGKGEGDDGPREQAKAGERDVGGPDQAPLKG